MTKPAILGASLLMALLLAPEVQAQDATSDAMIDIDVVAKRPESARQTVPPELGVASHGFSSEALRDIPGGENAQVSDVLVRAPGVALDSFGQVHLRGEHANLLYRLNGVDLPDGLSVFGQAIAGRVARSMTLIDGALPAEFGFRTAGVLDIQTKTGATDPGGQISLYGGSWNWLQPALTYGGQAGTFDYFVVMDGLHNDRGIENPSPRYGAIHDTTNQFHGLAYLSASIDPDTNVSLILGGFAGTFQIPNNPGQTPLNLNVNGVTSANSASLNERQTETTIFAVLSLKKHLGDKDFVLSVFNRTSTLRFSPDPIGDLLFNGIAQQAARSDVATGLQGDATLRINEAHTLRAGFLTQMDQVSANTTSSVLPVDVAGNQTTTTPLSIIDNHAASGGLYGIYVRDEWRISPALTLNYGLRFDAVAQFTHESQISPRVNLVWKPLPDTTLHIGYARLFTPPPYEALTSTSLAKFAGTTAAPEVTQDGVVRAERANYFDAGVSQVVMPGLTIGLDAYYKQSKNLIDEGQFGAPIILTAFNYAKGQQTGVELTGSYDQGPLSLYANAAWSRAMGKEINSAQYNFALSELAYIQNNFIHLDHDQTWTGSAGASYIFDRDGPTPTKVSGDVIVQSGLRASTASVPNGRELPAYATANLSLTHRLRPGTEVRLDVLNLLDARYEIRDGSGVGVGAPQYGIRRTILAGIGQRF